MVKHQKVTNICVKWKYERIHNKVMNMFYLSLNY